MPFSGFHAQLRTYLWKVPSSQCAFLQQKCGHFQLIASEVAYLFAAKPRNTGLVSLAIVAAYHAYIQS
jgi:hypothetical protein